MLPTISSLPPLQLDAIDDSEQTDRTESGGSVGHDEASPFSDDLQTEHRRRQSAESNRVLPQESRSARSLRPPPLPPDALQPVVLNTEPSIATGVSRRRAPRLGSITSISTGSDTLTPSASFFTVAVIGPQHCGKSSAIRKGMKAYNVSSSELKSEPFQYEEWAGTRLSDNGNILHVRALEIESSYLDQKATWPVTLSKPDAIILCYDATDVASFYSVENLVVPFYLRSLPMILFACKSDLPHGFDVDEAYSRVQPYTGLVQASIYEVGGKKRLRGGFDWIMRAINRQRRGDNASSNRNPASPSVLEPLTQSPWDGGAMESSSGAMTPTPSTATTSVSGMSRTTSVPASLVTMQISVPDGDSILQDPSTPRASTSTSPTSPARARSTNDLPIEVQTQTHKPASPQASLRRSDSFTSGVALSTSGETYVNPPSLDVSTLVSRSTGPNPYRTLEELLDKLFFVAVSGDEPTFVPHFFLTYRKFATPRSILLGMQKRIRELNEVTEDPMLASFAQMRICSLLDNWMKDYDHDFAVRGTFGALNALVKQIMSNTHTLHYGSDFLPFLEILPTLQDKDAEWAYVPDDADGTSTNSSTDDSDVDAIAVRIPSPVPTTIAPSPDAASPLSEVPPSGSPKLGRPRNTSIGAGYTGRAHSNSLTSNPSTISSTTTSSAPSATSRTPRQSFSSQETRTSSKDLIRQLSKQTQLLQVTESADIAKELTRMDRSLFLDIKPRDWLRHTMLPGKKDPKVDVVARCNEFYNHVSDWTSSLILCHDKPHKRVRQIEKLVDICAHLRAVDNYSSLRAIASGIDNSTFEGDETSELFKQRAAYKKHEQYQLLFSSSRAHKNYRVALINQGGHQSDFKGCCIPALEIHTSDLLRGHQGNATFKENDASQIHWTKFDMLGGFIDVLIAKQSQTRDVKGLEGTNKQIRQMIDIVTMDIELQQSRKAQPPSEFLDGSTSSIPITKYVPNTALNGSTSPHRDEKLRRILFWT